MTTRFESVIAAIDAANGRDPNSVSNRPGEVLYAERMTRTLGRLHPEASEQLKIAVRAQHIERWTIPRNDYPMDRIGYLRWRKDLQAYHAKRTGELMAAAGYRADDITRVAALLRKERMRQDAEAQALEDVACIVFLEDYFAAFAAKYDEAKVIDILRKTWAKMSPAARRMALELELSPAARRLVEAALAGTG